MTEAIPSPRGYPLIGNVLDIDATNPTASIAHLADKYGPIMKLYTPAERLYASNYAVAKDLFNEKNFEKAVMGPLKEVRNLVGDGLFTAYPGEHNWELAHRLLMPAFGPLPIKTMFPEMQDIVSQMILRWARFGPDDPIEASDSFTRLTLDSIAICAMGTRFNSFYHEDQHPFVHAMVGTLSQSFTRSRRLPLPSSFYSKQDQAYQQDIETCQNIARDLLASRRANPSDKKDLLNSMIYAKDSKTGEQLSDETIVYNMVTFLIAGHETTSGLLSFLFYLLLENPSAYWKLQEEIDTVIGKRAVTVDDMGKLPYLEACLRETLRLYPTAPFFTLKAKGDQVVGDGKYLLKDGQQISVVLSKFHRDPEVYGTDAEEFRPERMYKEAFTNLPENSWKPFGNGARACIGRPFAWQEAILAVAMSIQTFHFTKADPSYRLQIQTALTIKPKGFYMKAKLRDPNFVEQTGIISGTPQPEAKKHSSAAKSDVDASKLIPLTVLYGSNTGTCEALAQGLASSAPDQGFNATIKNLDDGVSSINKETPVVIFTASYEGQPPDNAGHFVEWITSSAGSEALGVPFAVFGVGNKEWNHTYQKIPKTVDEALAKNGATRLVDREETDVGSDKVMDKFDTWQDDKLWPALKKHFNVEKSHDTGGAKALKLQIDVQTRSSLLRQDTRLGEVTETSLLTTKPGAPRKRHIGIRLPSDVTYRAGDYLAILPLNPPSLVKRVFARFALPWDAMVTIDNSNTTSLPKGTPVSVHDLISSMVELEQATSARLINAVIDSIPNEVDRKRLQKTAEGGLSTPLLDILEEYSEAQFSLAQFLAALPPMRIRQYSISSTPLRDPRVVTLTYSVIDAQNKNGGKSNFLGVCTTYLERLNVGDRVHVSLKNSRAGFHLPADDSTAMIMACAGTGLAPFRAFVQERAIKKAQGGDVGPSLLFYGLNAPDEDDMYREQFDEWERQGVVSVRRAFTFKPEDSKGAKFVQERIWHDREEVTQFFRNKAQIYLCGAGVVGAGVEQVMAQIRSDLSGDDMDEAKKWVQELKGDRYWSDVFS